jgi:hypothetical protein
MRYHQRRTGPGERRTINWWREKRLPTNITALIIMRAFAKRLSIMMNDSTHSLIRFPYWKKDKGQGSNMPQYIPAFLCIQAVGWGVVDVL